MENGNAEVASIETNPHQPDTHPSKDPHSSTVESLKPGGQDRSLFTEKIPNGHVESELLPNGEAVVEGQEDGTDDTPPLATPSPGSCLSDSPLHTELDPGVDCFPDSLEKSEAALAEGSVHKGDALQSLRLSIPMQETELCKHMILDNPPKSPLAASFFEIPQFANEIGF